ncbi:alpha/beta fold hydrolase [Zavarzinia compransoris]|uniref:alpha/beta hydrolase n=1 Tax=Zavarzinia marina TaxID=2911065 RepID=UPI001F28E24D|nr:alpha/beta hydrolase [Zavarzinia marina]MCF4166440.1 alpha/beta fold hydrolase [Zavarzinia marina]
MKRVVVLLAVLAVAVPVVVLGVLPAVLLAAYRNPVPPPPADLPLAEVRFESADGVPLVAWSAEAAAPKATVVLVHGATGTRGDEYVGFYGMMRDLLGRDYSVLALDLRNHGESGAGPRPPSFGPDEGRDVVAAVDWIKARHPGRRVAVLGVSMGGNAAIYAAAADPRIEALITMDTYAVAAPVTARGVAAESGLPAPVVDAVLWGARNLWGFADKAGRAIDVVAGLGARPYLIIHSLGDPIVPFADAEALAAADPAAALWATPAPAVHDPLIVEAGPWGAHALSYRLLREQWVDQVTAFLDRTFKTMFG